MKFNAAFVVVSLTAVFAGTDQSTCRQPITCPCGKTGHNFSVCVRNTNLEEDPCVRWSNCKSCRDGLERCWECPEGFEDPFCNRATDGKVQSRQKRQSSRRKRPNTKGKRKSAVAGRYIYRGDRVEAFCDNPSSISLGRILLDPTSVPSGTSMDDQELPEGSRLQYSCNTGYTLKGPESLTCIETGFWSEDPPTCTRTVSSSFSLSCDDPGPILHGNVASSGQKTKEYQAGDRLEYSCNDGYSLNGSPTQSCDASGFWSGTRPTCEIDCGRSFTRPILRVINGTATKIGDWPWVVAIKYRPDSTIICGGALLDSTTIVTAAHCLTRSETYTLYFGKLNRANTEDDPEVKVRNSSRILRHPHFDPNLDRTDYDADIALILFTPPIEFSKRIQPICLPSAETTIENLVSGRRGDVTGWGLTERGRQPNVLMLANIPVLTNRECMESYKRLDDVALNLTQNQYCAGNKNGQQSLCEMDSGSPMVFRDSRTDRYTLEGLVSFRMGAGQCGRAGSYTVFTNVYKFVPWIRCGMNERECIITTQ